MSYLFTASSKPEDLAVFGVERWTAFEQDAVLGVTNMTEERRQGRGKSLTSFTLVVLPVTKIIKEQVSRRSQHHFRP